MKKRALIAAISIAMITLLMVGIQTIKVVQANFFIGPVIISYTPNSGEVYTNTTIPLKVAAMVHYESPEIEKFLYNINENSNKTLTNLHKEPILQGYEFSATSLLENLAEGNNTLNVYSQDTEGEWMSTSVEFMVDTQFKNPLLVLSPQNKTYTTTEVPLNFVCSEEIKLADYQLDNMGMGPISGNLTMSDLSLGEHKIIVVVWTMRGGFSHTLYFNVSEPKPFPVTQVLVMILIILGVIMVFSYLKHKRKT
jgi:hypothetical protein